MEGADAIVIALNPRNERAREIVAYHKRYLAERPGVGEWTPVEAATADGQIEGFRVVGPAGLGDLVGVLAEALRGHPDRNGDDTSEP